MTTENALNTELAAITDSLKAVGIELLGEKAKTHDLILKVNEIIEKLNTLEIKTPKAKDRGPDSQREMTEDDAKRISLGDLKDFSHKNAAAELGLSYGQVYSARKGFTFKEIYKAAKA